MRLWISMGNILLIRTTEIHDVAVGKTPDSHKKEQNRQQ